jgi:hypothetical protein
VIVFVGGIVEVRMKVSNMVVVMVSVVVIVPGAQGVKIHDSYIDQRSMEDMMAIRMYRDIFATIVSLSV